MVALVNLCVEDRLRGAALILLIDSGAVEGALVKGYSSREDLSLFQFSETLKLRVRAFIGFPELGIGVKAGFSVKASNLAPLCS